METFSRYLQEITRYPLLTKDQEIILARSIQIWLNSEKPTARQKRAGERAYRKLINCNLRLVVSIAKRYANRCRRTEMFDIVQEGNMGLAHGIKKFDPERGYALSTYVYWWIRQSITRYLSTHDRMIRLPSHAVEMMSKLRHWRPVFEGEHGRPPTIEECAEFCKTSPVRLKEYLDKSDDAISLDGFVRATDDDTSLMDVVTDGYDLFDDVQWGIDVEQVGEMLKILDDRERFIISGAFALQGGEPRTFQAMGKELGISRERTRNIYHRAVRRLRMKSAKTGLSTAEDHKRWKSSEIPEFNDSLRYTRATRSRHYGV